LPRNKKRVEGRAFWNLKKKQRRTQKKRFSSGQKAGGKRGNGDVEFKGRERDFQHEGSDYEIESKTYPLDMKIIGDLAGIWCGEWGQNPGIVI
jgi:hypothetical protein